MKYLFFLILMINIVFYLWEMNSDVVKEPVQRELSTTERNNLILLLDELEADENDKNAFIKNNHSQTLAAVKEIKKKTSERLVKTTQPEERQTKKSRQTHTQPESGQKERARVADVDMSGEGSVNTRMTAQNERSDQVQERISNVNSPEPNQNTENSGTVSEAVAKVEITVPGPLMSAVDVDLSGLQ